MKTNHQDDAKLFKKARFRVGLSLCTAFVLLCLYFIALYYILNQPVFGKPPSLDFSYLLSMVLSIVGWMLVFLALGSGNPRNRYFMYCGIVMEMLWTAYVFYMGWQAVSGQFAYFAWGLISLIQIYCLYCYSSWLKNSFYAKIFFDKTVEIYTPVPKNAQQQAPNQSMDYGSMTGKAPNFQGNIPSPAPAPQIQPETLHLSKRKQRKLAALMQEEAEARERARQAVLAQEQAMSRAREAARQEAVRQAALQEQQEQRARELALQRQLEEQRRQAELEAKRAEEARIAQEKKYAAFSGPTTKELMNSIKVKVVNYPLLAVRLGTVVYCELILFPILTEIFRKLFMSTDGQYSFATTGIFTSCIISAVIWTVAIFFLYLRLPASRKIVVLCIGMEIVAQLIYYYMTIKGYMSRPDLEYKTSVYIWFAIFDLLRYPLILWAIWPVFTLPVPKARAISKEPAVEEDYEDLFEGESEAEVAPSLAETLLSSYESIKDKTASRTKGAAPDPRHTQSPASVQPVSGQYPLSESCFESYLVPENDMDPAPVQQTISVQEILDILPDSIQSEGSQQDDLSIPFQKPDDQ